MANAKEIYSEASKYFCEVSVPSDTKVQEWFNKSKAREAEYNEKWKKFKVNLVDLVDKYAPNAQVYEKRYKFFFKGDKYTVVTDMVAGYARVQVNATKQYLDINGRPNSDGDFTHFKIKRKEEM